ncbi:MULTISPECIES: transglycosylase SLT domain-containing protein [unclassified Streptomyces]|uniref:transglycosylase SLT domain-containing protein n=1 Tax=unclassified Streptomyces TaxID=2593676 RepID=UPI000DAEB365|nr:MULTISPECIES: transglycosylase SLT domain-containing protein [unclassified Streptomyces]PZT74354.1 lytic transglycosylase [Streptomyces sp. AC1-42T]PZT82655.1 lytic transglycosylase [Streptomyces sp. AC1-42W]
MSAHSITGRLRRLNKTQKLSAAGISAVAAAALSLSLVPGDAEAVTEPQALSAAPVVFDSANSKQVRAIQDSVIEQHSTAEKLVKAADAAKAEKAAAVKEETGSKSKHSNDSERSDRSGKSGKNEKSWAKKSKGHGKSERKSEKKSSRGDEAASRSSARTHMYANNLDGWIRESLAIMKERGIPGTYEGLHRNIMRESSGNPNAINDWDINARNGVPSIGLLQIIKPTFDYYHVSGTPHTQYDPVANITASANYAADKYGSIDNVNSAY